MEEKNYSSEGRKHLNVTVSRLQCAWNKKYKVDVNLLCNFSYTHFDWLFQLPPLFCTQERRLSRCFLSLKWMLAFQSFFLSSHCNITDVIYFDFFSLLVHQPHPQFFLSPQHATSIFQDNLFMTLMYVIFVCNLLFQVCSEENCLYL